VVVTRSVHAGAERAYEGWLTGVGDAASRFAGHQGLTVIRPRGGARDYTLIFRFDTVDHLRAWEQSEERRLWVDRADALCETSQRQQAEGLEAWFSLPDGSTRPAPPRWKMATVSFLVAFPTIQILTATVGAWLAPLPSLARGAAVGVGMIVVMTYAAMPLATRLASSWLYPDGRKPGRNARVDGGTV
jgi:antibiotic biosynthesis monooxygenase (ABM) superfamily enzyme